jgi:phosphoenolpyruvate carboxylase
MHERSPVNHERFGVDAEANDQRPVTLASLEAALANFQARSAADPFSNPIVLFAIELTRQIDRAEVGLGDLDHLVRDLTVDAFRRRASRLGDYLGETDTTANLAAIATQIERLARNSSFDSFRASVERPLAGIVFTAHPTFAMPLSIARSLAELSCGKTRDGAVLDEAQRAKRLANAHTESHRPPGELTLEVEHAWSLEALGNAHVAVKNLNRIVFEVARQRWPTQWTQLTPHLITLASWVGYDQDGRTDVTSLRSFAVRLADKAAALADYSATVVNIAATAQAELAAAFAPAVLMLERAVTSVARQIALLADAERDALAMAEFSRAMVEGRRDALVDMSPLLAIVDSALGCATDDAQRTELLILRAALAGHGPGLAHVQVRLNASQLHNAIRRRVGLDTDPNDPSNRRSYFNTINDLLGAVRPVTISFAALMTEQASARRLMMTVAQMVKLVDAARPIRFLIAETETGFSLLAALYYARLFGVDRHVEISPLFETRVRAR